ncbi:AAA family ATPase, partial [Escherichia coli]|nr:AAA family ATPase [Escherichia coli]
LLLVGPTACKSLAVATWAAVLGRQAELTVVHLTPDTEASDLLGQIAPLSLSALLDEVVDAVDTVMTRFKALAAVTAATGSQRR